jgi:pyruvate/2-oxoglutarate dehydrogenase complex dihydrolipoamide acyltransferase (E2) component
VPQSEVRLAQYGMGMNDAEVVEWLFKVGDRVEVDQPIVVVDAAKVTIEVAATASGTLARVLKEEGEIADVGEVLAVIEHD